MNRKRGIIMNLKRRLILTFILVLLFLGTAFIVKFFSLGGPEEFSGTFVKNYGVEELI